MEVEIKEKPGGIKGYSRIAVIDPEGIARELRVPDDVEDEYCKEMALERATQKGWIK